MTIDLERAFATVRTLSSDAQDEIAELLLQLVGDDQTPIELTAEDEAWLAESLAQADRGEYASDAEVKALWRKHTV